MKCWEHSGFHVFVGEPVAADDEDARRFLARYLKKSPVMNPRLELIESHDEPVVRVHKFTDDSSQTKDFEPLAFLAELSQHIPDMWEQKQGMSVSTQHAPAVLSACSWISRDRSQK